MGPIIILIVALSVFVGIIVWAVKYTKKANAKKAILYGDFAKKHGCEHTQSKYMMAMLNEVKGEIEGMEFHMYEKMEGSGKNRHVVTRVHLNNTPIDFEFKIGKEHIFSKAGKMLGMKDIEFNNAEFDKKFLMKSKDEQKFRSLMNPNMQAGLSAIQKDMSATIYHKDNQMTYLQYTPLVKEAHFQSFERVFDYMLKLCKEKYY